MVIDFHELRDLSRISCDYNLAPLQPGPLCTSSGSTLVCATTDENSRELVGLFGRSIGRSIREDPGVNPIGCILDILINNIYEAH